MLVRPRMQLPCDGGALLEEKLDHAFVADACMQLPCDGARRAGEETRPRLCGLRARAIAKLRGKKLLQRRAPTVVTSEVQDLAHHVVCNCWESYS